MSDDDKPIRDMSKREFRAYMDRQAARDQAKKAEQFIEKLSYEAQAQTDADELNDFLKSTLGVTMDDLAAEYNIDGDPEFKKKIDDMLKSLKKGNTGRAKRIGKSKAVRDGAKRAKARKGWCPVWALVILAGAGGILYGAYEGVTALAGGLF